MAAPAIDSSDLTIGGGSGSSPSFPYPAYSAGDLISPGLRERPRAAIHRKI